MPIMKQKLVQDFFEAVEVDKLITKGQVDLETGIFVLRDMIAYVRDDIATMDKEAYKLLEKEVHQLGEQNKKWKDEQTAKTPEMEDDIDQRNFDRRLLKADHQKYKRELLFIQNLVYKKGWFD